MSDMSSFKYRIRPLAAAALLAAAGLPALADSNVNTTIQEGRINTNDTWQSGSYNDNATYQEGWDNANRTRQRGADNWNETAQFGRVNYNHTQQHLGTGRRGVQGGRR